MGKAQHIQIVLNVGSDLRSVPARTAAGAIGHADERGVKFRDLCRRRQHLIDPLVRLRRENFKGDVYSVFLQSVNYFHSV